MLATFSLIMHLPTVLRYLLARHRARWRERMRRPSQQLAREVQDILIGCGLTRAAFSVGGGRSLHVPEVVSMAAGPPVSLDIRILPGQMPDHYAKHAQTIAYNLDMAEVRVVPLGPYLIRLELLPKTP
jgi:hypothetical protein